MQIVFWIMFIVILAIAIFYWTKYEKECEHSYELDDKLCEIKYRNMKNRANLLKLKDLVDDYKHGKNVFQVIRDISDTIIKIELDTDQSN